MKLDTQKRIGANLKILRTCKDLSQADMAEIGGISRSLYTHYELANRTPDAEVLFKITHYFNLDMGTLFETEPHIFLSQVSNSIYSDDDSLNILAVYRKLSPFAQGMLLERAAYLLDWDKFKEKSAQKLKSKKDGRAAAEEEKREDSSDAEIE